MHRLFFMLSILVCTSMTYAETRASIGIGHGDIELYPTPMIFNNNAGENSVSIHAHVGYIFDNNLFIDIGRSHTTNDALFGLSDSIRFKSYDLAVGYTHHYKSFTFEAKLGPSRWQLNAVEGALFNPGPEESISVDGVDLMYTLSVGTRISPTASLLLTYKLLNFDDGELGVIYIDLNALL